MSYDIAIEKFTDTYLELEPLYRQHYSEMVERLASQGIAYSPYNPRLLSMERRVNEVICSPMFCV